MRQRWGKRLLAVLLAALLIVPAVGGQMAGAAETAVTKTAVELGDSIRMRGRSLEVGGSKTFDWSGSGFEFVYTGSGTITAQITSRTLMNGTWTGLVIVVDGSETTTWIDGTTTVTLASGLPAGEHTIQVYKLNEAAFCLAQLDSPTYPADGTLEPTQVDYRFEVIGDSITCGNQMGSGENGYKAYPTLLGRAFHATWNTESVSGRGLLAGTLAENNWSGSREHQMNELFDYTSWFRDKEAKWDFDSYTPDVLIVNLGTNDFGAAGLSAEEFCAGVEAFIARARELYPQAEIVWTLGLMTTDRTLVNAVKETVEAIGETDEKVTFLEMQPMQGGEAGHPNSAQHREAAQLLADHIAGLLGVEAPEIGDGSSTNPPVLPDGTVRYEAEDAERSEQVNVEYSDGFSGGGFARDLNQIDQITDASQIAADWSNVTYLRFLVDAPHAGEYTLTLAHFTTATGISAYIRVNDQPSSEYLHLTLDGGGVWNNVIRTSYTVTLNEGENAIWVSGSVLGNSTDNWINYDYIDLMPVDDPGPGPDPDPEPGTLGDVNNDGRVNSRDARAVLQYTVELVELTEEQLLLADMNDDELVNSSDARLILQATVS